MASGDDVRGANGEEGASDLCEAGVPKIIFILCVNQRGERAASRLLCVVVINKQDAKSRELDHGMSSLCGCAPMNPRHKPKARYYSIKCGIHRFIYGATKLFT